MSAVAHELRVSVPPAEPPLRELPPRHATYGAPAMPRVRLRVVLALLSLMLVLAGLVWLLVELGRHPVDSVRIAAEFRHLDRGELEAVVQPHLGQSFFSVDVDAVRAAARSLPWVREASVRRVWPGSIHIAIVEREAAFRWGNTGLLEHDASLYVPARREGFADLPLLAGPSGTESDVHDRYLEFQALLAAVGLDLRVLTLSGRGAWRAQLANGVTLVLGRDRSAEPMRRFVRAYPAALAARVGEVETVDLRYANGFAVLWKTTPVQAGEG